MVREAEEVQSCFGGREVSILVFGRPALSFQCLELKDCLSVLLPAIEGTSVLSQLVILIAFLSGICALLGR